MTPIRRINRVLYVIPVIGALAFGTAQAFASSTPPQEKAGAYCTTTQCNNYCGGPGTGACVTGRCICY
jgi:hypothetical protein